MVARGLHHPHRRPRGYDARVTTDDDSQAHADFARLYAPIAPALHAWSRLQVRGVLATSVDADDLVQEVCVQAYGSFTSYDAERGPFRSWLFGVAHHVVQMLLRKTARRHARGDRPEPLASRAERLPDEATTISRRVARDEGLAAFVRRLEELDEDDRRLLMYRGLEGLTHRDVGRLLDLPEETAKKRWLRLRERLATLPSARVLWDD